MPRVSRGRVQWQHVRQFHGRPPRSEIKARARWHRPVTLRTDLIILIIGFVFPMVSVGLDGLTYGSSVSVYPPDYWYLWGH